MDNTVSTVERAFECIQQNWPQAANAGLAITMSINRISRLLDDRMNRVLADLGLSNTEFEILAVLRSQPEPRRMLPTQFYEAVLMSSGGLTKVLRALESRQLVSRPVSAEDRRSRPIELTAAGKLLAEQGMLALQSHNEVIFAEIEASGSANDLCPLLIQLLKKMERGRKSSDQPLPEVQRGAKVLIEGSVSSCNIEHLRGLPHEFTALRPRL